ncbi:DUF6020 family protein [Hespellia stercorisuis]|uniref:Uncharacterized protein n=1 Tax=Hespellia stercorisuis DSM 15480 TaxID=1121950 RepID=A0A1M6J087_9FIRM|nr:DUF6020 family protein [Hespellia stercorisuis]SHJ40032.1 hypothetical protein SAMN02745243_00491 [Hespellia stercorisuis DSM 15480]
MRFGKTGKKTGSGIKDRIREQNNIRRNTTGRRENAPEILLASVLFSAFTVIGHSFAQKGNLDLILANTRTINNSCLKFIVLVFVFNLAIQLLYSWLEKTHTFKIPAKGEEKSRLLIAYRKHPFLYTWLMLFVLWLPYLIGYYPGIFMGDTSAQISQFFQLPNGVSSSVELISASQMITAHHPVVHTLMLGGFTKLGEILFHSDNAGIFMYTFLQYSVCSAALAYALTYVRRQGAPRWLVVPIFFIVGLYPTFPKYAVLLSKDAYFACFMLLFQILLLQWIHDPEDMMQNVWKRLAFIGTMVGVLLFRQNGILAVFFGAVVIFVYWRQRETRKKLVIAFGAVLGIFLLYSKVLLPLCDITPGSKREVLSIPFQQTARYLTQYADEVTAKEHDAIDAVLDYDAIKEDYNPNLSDPVKNTFREDATSEDLANYFKTWAQMFWKHPGTYVQATLNNYYGYFYFSWKPQEHHVRYHRAASQKFMDERINGKGFHFYHPETTKKLTDHLEKMSDALLAMPVFSWAETAGFYTWGLLLMMLFLLYTRDYRELAGFLPTLSIFLVCLISPANGSYYFRYSLSLAYLFPVLIGTCVKPRRYYYPERKEYAIRVVVEDIRL